MIEQKLIDIAKEVYNADPVSSKRIVKNVWARSAVAVILRSFGFSYTKIGDIFRKDHATIMHCVRKHADNLIFDKEYRDVFLKFEAKVNRLNLKNQLHIEYIRERMTELSVDLFNLGHDIDSATNIFSDCVNEARLITAS